MRILIITTSKTGSTLLTYCLKSALPDHKIAFEPPTLDAVDSTERNLICKYFTRYPKVELQRVANYDRLIFLVRHPFDQLISRLLYTPHNGKGFIDDRNVEQYVTILEEKQRNCDAVTARCILETLCDVNRISSTQFAASGRTNLLNCVVQCPRDCLIFKYEDLLYGEFDSLCSYLGFPRIRRVDVAPQYKRVRRSARSGDWKVWFTTGDVFFFSGIPEVKRYLDFFGYDADVDRLERGAAPVAEAAADYVVKVVNEFRQSRHLTPYRKGEIQISDGAWSIANGFSLLHKKDPKKALREFDVALGIYPGMAGLHYWRSKALEQMHQFDAAYAACQMALREDPTNKAFGHYARHLRSAAAAASGLRKC